MCPVCVLPLSQCICEDEPILECPNTPDCNIVTCNKCNESYCSTHKTHECENIPSDDHGTGICAECWMDDPDNCYYEGDLESHGHKDSEIYDYTLALKFENNDKNTVTICDGYEIYTGETGDFETVNSNKKSVYDFTWSMNDVGRVSEDEDEADIITSSLSYDSDIKKWVILFECSDQNDEDYFEICKVYLEDGKTPLGMKAYLKSGTVEVIIND